MGGSPIQRAVRFHILIPEHPTDERWKTMNATDVRHKIDRRTYRGVLGSGRSRRSMLESSRSETVAKAVRLVEERLALKTRRFAGQPG